MTQAERILFVDDDEPVRKSFSRSLRGYGFDIDLASGAEEAFALLQDNEYAVVATDYRMPEVNGLELVHEMRQEYPDSTYILISGECDLELALEAVNEHAVAFVVCKPWDTTELVSVLRRSMEAYWERASQRRVQASMMAASRDAKAQKEKLREAMLEAQSGVTEVLLSALDLKGYETRAHCQRVAAYALLIAEQMGLRGATVESLRQGALLHDVGKLGIPDSILENTGPLSAEEWKIMRKHTQMGADLLTEFKDLEGAQTIVAQHHERWDGTGYPQGLAGEQINLNARIFSVADTLDAILSDQRHRQAESLNVARAEIERCAGAQLDPRCVEAFLKVSSQALTEVRQTYPDAENAPVYYAPARERAA